MPGQKAAEQSLIDFLNSDPRNQISGLEARIQELLGAYQTAVRAGDQEQALMLNEEINRLDAQKIKIKNSLDRGRTMSDIDRALMGGRTMSDLDRQMGRTMSDLDMSRPQLKDGGDFPDLTGDGKVTQADILKGRGVFAEGGEVDEMLAEVQESPVEDEAAAMGMLEGSRQDFEILEQIIQVIMNLMQQGFTEGEIIALLKEQGLDDEDAKTAVEYAKEMMGQAQQAGQAEQDIGAQLAALG